MRRGSEQQDDDFAADFPGEPGPIVFGPDAAARAGGEETDRIVFPLPGESAPPPFPAAAPPRSAAPRRGRSGLVRGLVLGCAIGAVAGGFVALAIDRLQSRQPAVRTEEPPAMAQSLIPVPAGAEPPPPVAEAVSPAPAPKRSGLDLGALAAAIGLRAPNEPAAMLTNSPAVAASAPTPVEPPLALRQSAEETPRLPPTVTAVPKAEPPPLLAPAPAEKLALGPIAPPSSPARPVAAPSFDCGRARSRAEQAVCGDPALALADRRLLQAYDRAMASSRDRAGLHDDQAQWLSERDQLGADHEALMGAYRARIRDLEAYDRRNRRAGLGRLLP